MKLDNGIESPKINSSEFYRVDHFGGGDAKDYNLQSPRRLVKTFLT